MELGADVAGGRRRSGGPCRANGPTVRPPRSDGRRRRAIERILTQYSDVDADDLDYLLAKLSEFSGTIAAHA